MSETISCEYLHYGIALHSKGVRVCCKKFFRNDNEYAGNPFICDYVNGKVPFGLFISRKIKIINQINNGIENDCTGCKRLKKKNWSQLKEVKIKKLLLQHRKICNLRCSYFNLSRDQNALSAGIDAYPVISKMIDEGMLSNNLVVHWGSGEPTIFPDFNELFKLLCEFGAIHTLSSNSTVFSQTLYDYLNNVKNITTSIDAGYPATYKAIRGRDMLHNVLKNLSVYANKKPDALTIQYVICKPGDKKEEIDQFIKNITSYSLNLCNFSITSDVEQPLTNQYLRSCRYLVQKLSEIIDPDKINISRHIIQRIGSFNGHYDIIAQNKAFKLIINRHNLRKNISSRLDSAVREFKRKSRRKINKRLNKLDNKVL